MINVKKRGHSFDIIVDERVVTISYAEWIIIKKQMKELIMKEISD